MNSIFKKIINIFKKNNYVYKDKKLHNENGPAIVYKDGGEEWWFNGVRHRLDGPAVIGVDGKSCEWYINGERHRDDDPAILLYTNGNYDEYYYFKGKKHNLKGPAVSEWNSGHKEWWVLGFDLSKNEFDLLPRNDKGEIHSLEEIKISKLDGLFMSNFVFYALNGKVVDKVDVDKYILENQFPISKIGKKVKI